MAPSTPPLVGWLATLGDLSRLRVLRLLHREELGVGELALALQIPQSTVSRHLKVLHDAAWVRRRVEGTASYYRLFPADLDPGARDLWELARSRLGESATFEEDDVRLAEVIAQRATDSRSFFGRVGGDWDHMRRELFGADFTGEALLALLPANWVVADIGCGTGNAGELLAPLVRRVIAIDREDAMLEAARRRLQSSDNVEFRRGDLLALPLEDGEVDAAVTMLVLHHLDVPGDAVREMARVLRAGGIGVIVDMVSHDRDTYRHTMGHRHLGFSREDIDSWASSAGIRLERYARLRPDTHAKGPGLFAATLRKA